MKAVHKDFLTDLPGEEFIRPGLIDFLAKRITVESLLAAMASNRLREYGILDCEDADLPVDAELKLYGLLTEQHADPYTQYRAYTGRLHKFECALDCRVNRV